ncbi:MAG: pyridoxal 5'-phosphate synthase glutaminase subunit PdxT [Acidobacteria bacterium]|nr:pyridoxal 5'-phosphate synthase glutaminase subunit PdxT [Acidobacteriota bacterium]
MRCGVLALQGDWEAHARVLERAGSETIAVRTPEDLEASDALVLPGGESTVVLRLLEREGWMDRLTRRLAAGLPVLATCAGVILLARDVTPPQASFGVLDIAVRRNAYGRQVASAIVPVRLAAGFEGPPTMEGVFIRAPRIERVGPDVDVLGWRGDAPALVRQGRIVAATFHPEMTPDDRVHRYFLHVAGGLS